MCRTYDEVEKQDPIIHRIENHKERNNLDDTSGLLLDVIKELYIKKVISDEKQEELDRYPSLLWLAVKKPMCFFPGLTAFLLIVSTFYIQEIRQYILSYFGLPMIDPEHYLESMIPAFIILVVISFIGGTK